MVQNIQYKKRYVTGNFDTIDLVCCFWRRFNYFTINHFTLIQAQSPNSFNERNNYNEFDHFIAHNVIIKIIIFIIIIYMQK